MFGSARVPTRRRRLRAGQARSARRSPSAGGWSSRGPGPGAWRPRTRAPAQGAELRREHPSAVRGRAEPSDRRRPEADQLQVLLHAQAHVHQGSDRRSSCCPAGSARWTRRSSSSRSCRPARATCTRSFFWTSRAAPTGPGFVEFVRRDLVDRGYVSASDLKLFTLTDDASRAADEIIGFYPNYDSMRFVGRGSCCACSVSGRGPARGAERDLRRHHLCGCDRALRRLPFGGAGRRRVGHAAHRLPLRQRVVRPPPELIDDLNQVERRPSLELASERGRQRRERSSIS